MCGCGTPASPRHWGSTVTVRGAPAVGNVLFVNGKGAVVAEAPIVNGRYELATRPIAQMSGLVAIFRIEAPNIGIREIELTNDAPPALEIDTAGVLTIHAGIELPKSVTFDWVDVEITPLEKNQPTWSIKRHLTMPNTELQLLSGT